MFRKESYDQFRINNKKSLKKRFFSLGIKFKNGYSTHINAFIHVDNCNQLYKREN
jgi:hypothetical protein